MCFDLTFLPFKEQITFKSFEEVALKVGVLSQSTIENKIKDNGKERQRMLVFIYGIQVLENGDRVPVDEVHESCLCRM